jgi:hypothetical protein
MTLFENVLSISTTKINSDDRALLKLTIAGSSEVEILSFNFTLKKSFFRL